MWTLEQLFAETRTSNKPRKIYRNYSENTRSHKLQENTNLKEIIEGTRIKNGKVKNYNVTSRTGICTPCLSFLSYCLYIYAIQHNIYIYIYIISTIAFFNPLSISHEYKLNTNLKHLFEDFLSAEINFIYLCISLHAVIHCGENI